MTNEAEYLRSFLDWVDVCHEMHPNDPKSWPCGFSVNIARRGYEAALRDADRDPGSEP